MGEGYTGGGGLCKRQKQRALPQSHRSPAAHMLCSPGCRRSAPLCAEIEDSGPNSGGDFLASLLQQSYRVERPGTGEMRHATEGWKCLETSFRVGGALQPASGPPHHTRARAPVSVCCLDCWWWGPNNILHEGSSCATPPPLHAPPPPPAQCWPTTKVCWSHRRQLGAVSTQGWPHSTACPPRWPAAPCRHCSTSWRGAARPSAPTWTTPCASSSTGHWATPTASSGEWTSPCALAGPA